ncbi:Uncharacterised protein [Segatella copri]|nr:Uncharacterised protein [Segatella copri]
MNACVNKEAYAHHAGGYVKNAYDPQFNVDGVWDKKASDKRTQQDHQLAA